MGINQAGIDLIKSFESCKLKAYQDVGGIWTVGYGHTGKDVHPEMEINQAMADAMLDTDLLAAESGVTALLKISVNDNQFSALVSFAFNCGLSNLAKSTLLNCINHNNCAQAADEFLKWSHVNGIVIPGLLRRREAERLLFKA